MSLSYFAVVVLNKCCLMLLLFNYLFVRFLFYWCILLIYSALFNSFQISIIEGAYFKKIVLVYVRVYLGGLYRI